MNPYIKTEDVEIDLLDLVKYLLRRAVCILIAGIVCAGIACAYQYHRLKNTIPDTSDLAKAQTEYELEMEQYEGESELIGTSDASTTSLIRKQEEYLRTAPFMKLDPYHVWKAEAIIQVVSDSETFPAWQLEEMYKSELLSEDYLQELAKERGTDASYLKEMILAVSTDEAGNVAGTSTSQMNTNAFNVSDVILREDDANGLTTSRVFVVRAYGDEEEEAKELMDVVLDELQGTFNEKKKDNPHEMSVLSNTCTQTVDMGIQARQKDHVTYTQTLLYQMNYNAETAGKLSRPAATVSSMQGSISRRSLLKYGLIGFVIGVLLSCVWYAIRYIRNDKLVDYKDVGRKGISVKDLGTISEQGTAMAAANIRNFAGEKKKLFLTGMSAQTEFDSACAGLKEYLAGYEIVCAGDVIHDPKARDLLPDCDAAVLVEQKGVTRYSNMKDEIIFLFNAGKEIIGMVIV